MNVTLNGEPRHVTEGLTLADWVTELGLVSGRLACEVNGQVIRRADYATVHLSEGDQIEMVQMIGGG
ncbi:MAG: sulfur carrier protein ThiS [Elusimicrobia bacterium]|jgi:sulfur carrier protein|nr:sulfur carrier protein ThiS [Elusimicrobiota bacterium]